MWTIVTICLSIIVYNIWFQSLTKETQTIVKSFVEKWVVRIALVLIGLVAIGILIAIHMAFPPITLTTVMLVLIYFKLANLDKKGK